MSLKIEIHKHTLKFNFDAGTSRGVLKEKDSWFIKLYDKKNPDEFGIGECSVIPRLSIDDVPEYEKKLEEVKVKLENQKDDKIITDYKRVLDSVIPVRFPSIRFGFEMAFIDYLTGGKRMIFLNDFSKGKKSIPINGLIWMGDQLFMLKQIRQKLKEGFQCVKLKIGAIDFQSECNLLDYIREQYATKKVIIRLDANGAFNDEDVFEKLDILQEFNIHSLEQPVPVKKHRLLKKVIDKSNIPIALDEELIGIFTTEEKLSLLKNLMPHYIIIKPSLLGGIEASREWISIAESLGIGWWITSALESNIGLNAIAQFTAEYPVNFHQGLGTGQLYTNNIPSPLTIQKGMLKYDPGKEWQINDF